MVGRDVQARGALLLDAPDDVAALALHRHAQRLDVRHVHRQLRLVADADHLVDRALEADVVHGLVADVAVVQAAVRGRHLREFDDLLGLREILRRVEQARRQPERTVAHRAGQVLLHRVHLRGRGGAVGLAELADAQRPEARVHRDVGADRHGAQLLCLRRDVVAAEAVVADHGRGHALREKGNVQALARVAREQVGVGVRVGVDEAGRHHEAGGVDGAARAELRRHGAAREHDAVARDADVADHGRVAVARVDGAAAQQQVELDGGFSGGGVEGRGEGRENGQRDEGALHGRTEEESGRSGQFRSRSRAAVNSFCGTPHDRKAWVVPRAAQRAVSCPSPSCA
ncbi:hypothetical protein D9M68_556860 [compost metagenome]